MPRSRVESGAPRREIGRTARELVRKLSRSGKIVAARTVPSDLPLARIIRLPPGTGDAQAWIEVDVPSADAIRDSLAAIANDWRAVAVFWHVYVAGLLVATLRHRRPSQQLVGCLLVLPLISVSALAWGAGNPVNGTVFGFLAAFLMRVARRLPDGAARISVNITGAAGVLLVAFAWVYPHFLAPTSWTTYLVAAPLGLVPCPTLAAVIGITLLLDHLGSTAWSVTLGAVGLAYGVIGIIGLGVLLDVGLLAGAIVLLVATATKAAHKTIVPA